MSAEARANRGRSAGPANRRALITAAREVFSEGGFSAPLSAVARRAGVGQGSLYRHFPDRIALALAVFDDNIAELEALGERPDARMSDLFDAISEQAIASTALIDMISTERHDPRAERLAARVSAVAAAVLARDQAEGRIRGGVTGDDVMLAVSMLAFLLSRTEHDERPAVAEQARRIFSEGFATPGG